MIAAAENVASTTMQLQSSTRLYLRSSANVLFTINNARAAFEKTAKNAAKVSMTVKCAPRHGGFIDADANG